MARHAAQHRAKEECDVVLDGRVAVDLIAMSRCSPGKVPLVDRGRRSADESGWNKQRGARAQTRHESLHNDIRQMRRSSRNTGAVSFRTALVITAFAAANLFVAASALARDEPPPSATAVAARAFPQPVGWPKVLSSAVTAEHVGPGVMYERWTLSTDAGPLTLSIATIDMLNPNVALAVETHAHLIIGKGERLSSMADRQGAELGINADYFDINESGAPLNVVAIDWRVLHQPSRAAAFVVDGRGRINMGPVGVHAHVESANGASRDIMLVNDWSSSAQLALLTPELGTDAGFGATEMLLEPSGARGQYKIAHIEANVSLLAALGPDQFAIAARGDQAQSLAHDFHEGDLVALSWQTDPPGAGIKLGVGGGPLLLKDGQAVDDPDAPAPEETNVRNPVTGAGLSADGATLWLAVVDGRQPSVSVGLTRPQFAALFLALGATTAMAFDSGGSSEMVIRHLGDPVSSVANTPSDGRERSIADGLFIRNTAPQGPAVKLILKAASAQILAGSVLGIQVRAVDANDQPVPVRADDITFATDPTSVARIDAHGIMTALTPGVAQVTAGVGRVRASVAVRVVGSVDDVRIVPANPSVVANAKVQLSVSTMTRDGNSVAVDPAAVRWTDDGKGGHVLSDGTFVAGSSAARTVVTASVGDASGSTVILSGEHGVMLQALPKPGLTGAVWHFEARPSSLPGAVDGTAAPDGSQALRLAYDFSNAMGTRAAYAQTELTLPGQPLAVAFDIFGDGNGEWLRGGYRNADGNDESLTIARHVDWRGWKAIRVAVPPQAAWPIVWTRLYVVERAANAREQGSLWFRNFQMFIAGP